MQKIKAIKITVTIPLYAKDLDLDRSDLDILVQELLDDFAMSTDTYQVSYTLDMDSYDIIGTFIAIRPDSSNMSKNMLDNMYGLRHLGGFNIHICSVSCDITDLTLN